MWFKNLQVFNLERDWTLPPGTLEAQLSQKVLTPCPALAMQNMGWIAPGETPGLVQSLERHLLIALAVEQKLLPASVINDLAATKAAQWQAQRGFKPGRKLLREFKERAAAELLPRAFVRRRATRAWIDPQAGRIAVDASSPARAELVMEHLRETLGELAITLPQPDPAPGATLTAWLLAGQAPGGFTLGEDCELTGGGEQTSVVRYLRHPLQIAQVRRHLDEGCKATRLALTWNERVSLTVTDKLEIKRLSFLAMDREDKADSSVSPEERFEADFALMTGELSRLLDDLLKAFGAARSSQSHSRAHGDHAVV